MKTIQLKPFDCINCGLLCSEGNYWFCDGCGSDSEGNTGRFDYAKQAWVENGRYVRCGHPDSMGCKCYGRTHEGETA